MTSWDTFLWATSVCHVPGSTPVSVPEPTKLVLSSWAQGTPDVGSGRHLLNIESPISEDTVSLRKKK